ncbi:MAG: hypothetical protein AMXMBFR33_60390 [Candidatus Xenobia bacterium]
MSPADSVDVAVDCRTIVIHPGHVKPLEKKNLFRPGRVYLIEMSMQTLLIVLLGALLGLGFSYLSKASGFG